MLGILLLEWIGILQDPTGSCRTCLTWDIANVRVRMAMNVSEQFRIRNRIAEPVAYSKCEGEDGNKCQ